MAYEKRDAEFTKWLEEEHPAHSQYDHENLGAYRRWLEELQTAFNAGWNGRKKAVDYYLEGSVEQPKDAGVAKSVDALGLGPSAARRGGSSPSTRTNNQAAIDHEFEITDRYDEALEHPERCREHKLRCCYMCWT